MEATNPDASDVVTTAVLVVANDAGLTEVVEPTVFGNTQSKQYIITENRSIEEGAPCNVTWKFWKPNGTATLQIPTSNPKRSTMTMTMPYTSLARPIFVPSFPGSGAEMFRDIIQAITGGIPGWSVYDELDMPKNMTCHSVHAATCKTHWPILAHRSPSTTEWLGHYHSHAIILMRNPAKAFASRLNHLWEINHGLEFHSQQAPEKAWNRWIKRSFQQQLNGYESLIRQWTNHPHYDVALYLPYEDLIDEERAPKLLQKVADELLRAQVPHVASSLEDLTCLWRYVVKTKPKKKRAGHTYQPGYTSMQHSKLLKLFDQIIAEFSNVTDLVDILRQYRHEVQNKTRLVD